MGENVQFTKNSSLPFTNIYTLFFGGSLRDLRDCNKRKILKNYFFCVTKFIKLSLITITHNVIKFICKKVQWKHLEEIFFETFFYCL